MLSFGTKIPTTKRDNAARKVAVLITRLTDSGSFGRNVSARYWKSLFTREW